MAFSNCVKELMVALEKAKQRVPMSKEGVKAINEYDFGFPVHLLELELCEDKELSGILGVSKQLFPPEPELDDAEIKAVVAKILEVWAEFNYYADFPHGLPLRKAYTTLLGVWDEKVMSSIFGTFHFDFYTEELDLYVEEDADPDTTFQEVETPWG